VHPQSLELSRRAFGFGVSAAVGGLVTGLFSVAAAVERGASAEAAEDRPPEITAWVTIAADDTTTIRVARSEMGQGSFTALPMLVAEELECDWGLVRAEYVEPGLNIARNHAWGDMTTAASIGIRKSQKYLRKAGAQARQMLIDEAAARWDVPAAECAAHNSTVTHLPTGRTIRYGALAEAAARRPVPKDVVLKKPAEWRLIGTSVHRLETRDKISGKQIYAGDIRLPGMLYATVSACPSFGGKLVSHDAAKVMGMPGVRHVVPVNGMAVAVLADTWWQAKTACDALPIVWDRSSAKGLSTDAIRATFSSGLDAPDAGIGHRVGNVSEALAGAATTLQADYEVPYLAHTTMEPQTCVAHVKDGRAEVWAPTQNGEGTLRNVARALGIDPSQVTVHKQHLGGGFGRRGLAQDWARMAALIAKQVDRPVMMVWSREEDVQHDYYRPMILARQTAGFDRDGNLVAWKARMCGSSIRAGLSPERLKDGVDVEMMSAFLDEDMVYDVPHFEAGFAMRNVAVPVGFWRGVNHTQNGFFRESFVDEMAHARGADPYLFRRKLLAKAPRSLAVLDEAARRADWGHVPAGVFQGIALVESYDSVTAQVVEISISRDGKLTVRRVVCVIDAGTIVNPRNVEAQFEGAVAFALTAALYGRITLEDGAVQQSNFHDYPALRLKEMPVVETHFVSSATHIPRSGAASASPERRRWRPRCATPCSRRPASASGRCRWRATSWRCANRPSLNIGAAICNVIGSHRRPAAPASHLPPPGRARIGQHDVDRTDAEDRDHDRLGDGARHAVIVERAGGSLDEAAGRHRHGLARREVGAAVHPPCAGHDHLDAVGGVAVRRAEPARMPFDQHQIGPGLVDIAVEPGRLAAAGRQSIHRREWDGVVLQDESLLRIDHGRSGGARQQDRHQRCQKEGSALHGTAPV
jgi:isoquinoline 1-oxidoreductase beta subunit